MRIVIYKSAGVGKSCPDDMDKILSTFYSAKAICIELGIKSRETLDRYVRIGFFPPYERSPTRANGVGYFENTFKAVKLIELPKVGRPKNKEVNAVIK